MDKLSQITVENSLNLVVSYQVDQSLLARNFTTIVNALKELRDKQALSESKIKDLSSLIDKQSSLSQRLEKIQNGSPNHTKQNSSLPSDGLSNASMLSALSKRVDKNENSILDNIKDINLLNKEISEAKSDIQDLKKRLNNQKINDNSKGEQGSKKSYNINDVAQNLNKQLSKSEQSQKSLANRLSVAQDNIQKLQKALKNMLQNTQNNSSGQSVSNQGASDTDFEGLKKDLKEKLEVINKKISNIQSDTDQHDRDISYLKQAISQIDANKGENEGQLNNEKSSEHSKNDLSQLRKRIEQVNQKEKRDIRALQQEINSLKLQLKGIAKSQRVDSKTSLEQENSKSNRKIFNKDRDQLSQKLNDLILKVAYLQKLIAGSKNSLSDQKNTEKLPNITRLRKREANMTMYHQKDKSGITRKDLAELKAELQTWLKTLLQQNQNRQNFEVLELKLQQIRRNVQKKADGQGTKKGFTFLQNKITQLYLFLTEPQTQDAMIVKKGFNCLSCSKKVQKLRGKLGPHLNWNNMTSTNYSPPRVGYSKPMGQNSVSKEDDL